MFKTEISQMECGFCHDLTRHERNVRHANHILHLLLTLLTLGVWAPIWILLALFPDKEPWHCSICGSAPDRGVPNWIALAVAIPLLAILIYGTLLFRKYWVAINPGP